MPRKPAKKKRIQKDKLYVIVERLRAQPLQTSRGKKMYNFSDPTALRALRIHRHLRALENDILEHAGTRAISLAPAEDSDQIVISIRNDLVHCRRMAYLSPKEFRLLRKNRKVANVLRKCPAYADVA
jgi:hypothetical protein